MGRREVAQQVEAVSGAYCEWALKCCDNVTLCDGCRLEAALAGLGIAMALAGWCDLSCSLFHALTRWPADRVMAAIAERAGIEVKP